MEGLGYWLTRRNIALGRSLWAAEMSRLKMAKIRTAQVQCRLVVTFALVLKSYWTRQSTAFGRAIGLVVPYIERFGSDFGSRRGGLARPRPKALLQHPVIDSLT